jgi:hypothetical protein
MGGMRNRVSPAILTISLLLTGLCVNAAGQLSGQPYRISDREVSRLLDRIRNKTEGFRQNLKKALNKSRIDGTRREDNINDFVKAFEAETKRLDDHFDHHKSTAADVESVIQRAARIDSFMTAHPLDQLTQAAWETLRSDLELLAGAYNVSWQWGNDRHMPPLVESPYRVNDRQVEDIIHRIESQAETFRKSLDSALDKSRFDGTRHEDDINSFVKEFYQETKRLHEHFDGHKSTASDVQQVLDRASQINQFMRRNRLTKDTQRDWAQLRSNLDELASVYNVRWQWL